MAVDSLRARHSKRRFNIITCLKVYLSVWNHPFLVAMLLVLICLQQYFPFVFSLLVSAAPVIVCTALLLGALLIHGQPNDHRVEYHGLSSTFSSLRTGVPEHFSSAGRNGIFSNDRFVEVRNDLVERSMEVSGMAGAGIRAIDDLANGVEQDYFNSEQSQGKSKAGSYFGYFEDIDFQMPETQAQNHVTANNKVLHLEVDAGMKENLDLVTQGFRTPQETRPLLDSEDPLHPDPSHHASRKSEMQSLDLSLIGGESDDHTVYLHEEEEDEIDNDDDDDEDGTPETDDGGEKSAVTWTEDDQKIFMELTNSEMEKNEQLESLIARISHEINDGKVEEEEEAGVSEDVDNDDKGCDDDDDDDDDEDKEEEEYEENNQHLEKGESKPVTMWTEEDEKNLRALGTSEMERNQRLENLLARRRVRRNFSMISERNLIDLDFSDLPFQVPPISTTRVNPFDIPDDTNHNVPPIPGSAPSITLPRKNPFDSPSSSPKGAENPLKGSHKKESMERDPSNPVFHTNASSSTEHNPIGDTLPEFMEINRKEATLRRYESFGSGYDFMVDASGQDFMETERRDAVFRRHESFSVRPAFPSIFNPEKPHRRHWRPVFVSEQLATEEAEHRSPERQSSQDSECTLSSLSESESSTVLENYEDVEESTSYLHQNGDDITTENHVASHSESESAYSELDQNGDQTTNANHTSSHSESESEYSELDQNGDETTKADHVSSHSESESAYPEAVENGEDQDLAASVGVAAGNIYQKILASEETYDTASSTSMSSKEDAKSPSGDQCEEAEVGDSVFSPKASLDESHIKYMSTEEDHEEIEPVYDESPSAVEKNIAYSSTSTQI